MSTRYIRVPDDALAQALGIIARTGGGKSYTARGLVEPIVERQQVVIIDPTGVWWGLRLKPDGKTPSGLPVVILGGDHGDVSLAPTPDAAAAAARLICGTKRSVIVDVSEFGVGERDRFASTFFDTLYRERPRSPLTLVVDEADAFAPQKPLPEQRVMASRLEQIVRRGRVRGYRPWLITQRPAVINKDVLGMVGTMICLQLTLPHDRAAMEAWVRGHADPETGRHMLESLPGLAIGEGWVWSPRARVLERGKFHPIRTFDSMRAPEEGDADVDMPPLSPSELSAVAAQFGGLVSAARRQDPVALQARIDELEAENRALAGQDGRPDATEEKSIRQEEYKRGWDEGRMLLAQQYRHAADQARKAVGGAIHIMEQARDWLVIEALGENLPVDAVESATIDEPRTFIAPPPRIPRDAPTNTGEPLGRGERTILTALSQHPAGLDRTALAIMAGYAHNGGGFRNYLGSLKGAGHIQQDGDRYRITPAGRARVGPVERLPTGPALLRWWCERSGKGERAILEALGRAPQGLTQEALAQWTGYEANGGGFRNYLGRLRTLGLVVGDRARLDLAATLR